MKNSDPEVLRILIALGLVLFVLIAIAFLWKCDFVYGTHYLDWLTHAKDVL